MGYALKSVNDHALLWTGTGASAIDLNPPKSFGFSATEAFGTNGTVQAGYGFGDETGNGIHAVCWNGSPQSILDLQNILPVGYLWNYSKAYSVDSAGDVFGIAQVQDGTIYAVEWSPVPEPVSGIAVVIGLGMLLSARQRNRME